MLAVAGVSFVAGLVFLIAGAWPVIGIFGLDVALIYWAFRANYRAARAYEQIWVTPTELIFRKVSARGAVTEWRANPLWVRLDRDVARGIRRAEPASGLARAAPADRGLSRPRREGKLRRRPCRRR